MLQKCFSFNEIGVSPWKRMGPFLRDTACLGGPAVLSRRSSPGSVTHGGPQGLVLGSGPQRMAVSVTNDGRIAAAGDFRPNPPDSAAPRWPFMAGVLAEPRRMRRGSLTSLL